MERITCAAIQLCDGLVITGAYHGRCFQKAKTMGRKEPSAAQGFMTSFERFIDRKEALIIAEAQGQIKHKHNPKDILLSEDLK